MNKRKTVAVLAIAALVALAFSACPLPDGGSKPVTIASIPGAIKPITGRLPATAAGATEQYTGAVSWSPLVTGTFAPGEPYTATITLTANPGYTFAGVAADFFTVAGAASARNARNSNVVTAVFPATGGPPVAATIASIPGVTAPLTYETPVAAIAETEQYTGTVAWSPAVSGLFAAETEYTATISLEAKVGFTFDGVAADFFTVAGATWVGNAANSGVVTAAFPATPFMAMAWISGGTFMMGSPANDPDRQSDETPRHEVTLGGFWMGKYEVTQGEYEEVMGENPAKGSPPAAGETEARRPVYSVSWYDALVFCNRLSMIEGLAPAYSIRGRTDPVEWGGVPTREDDRDWDAAQIVPGSNGYRLPTEAQWEYACRAGTTTVYNTGASISDDTGWYDSNIGGGTHEVGKKPANAWGLYDMHGNAGEWCWDWYSSSYYASAAAAGPDPVGPVSGYGRVFRGGSSIRLFEQDIRSAVRSGSRPSDRYGAILGFRLVRP